MKLKHTQSHTHHVFLIFVVSHLFQWITASPSQSHLYGFTHTHTHRKSRAATSNTSLATNADAVQLIDANTTTDIAHNHHRLHLLVHDHICCFTPLPLPSSSKLYFNSATQISSFKGLMVVVQILMYSQAHESITV